MAKNRKNQPAAVRFGPVLKVFFLCMLICSMAIGYVWQKNEISRLGGQIHQRELALKQLETDNQRLSDQVAILHLPLTLDQRVKELNLGLVPAQPGQVVWLTEMAPEPPNRSRQLAQRPEIELTP